MECPSTGDPCSSLGRLQALIQDPELMAYLRNPRMQEVMKKVMTGGPEAAKEDMGDPEVVEMLRSCAGSLLCAFGPIATDRDE